MAEFVIPGTDTSPLALLLRAASGAADGDDLYVVTPTFHRPTNLPPAMIPPADRSVWAALQRLGRDELKAWGLLPFGAFSTEPPPADGRRRVLHRDAVYYDLEDENDPRPKTHELWLFPGSWYRQIPTGFPIVSIFGELEEFEIGKTDNDIRYGCLAYGLMIPIKPSVSVDAIDPHAPSTGTPTPRVEKSSS
jgi:hypothetical protein